MLSKNIINFLFKYERWLQALAIFLLLCSVSFGFDEGNINWTWQNRPLIALFLVFIGLMFMLIIIGIKNRQIQSLKVRIAESKFDEDLILKLTPRQAQVLRLIQSGKSNKEIAKELFIEFSTLKTHINKIYKTLGVKNRREAQSLTQSQQS